MANVNKIYEQAIKNIKNKGLSPTPNVYNKEYCHAAHELHFNAVECKKFQEFVAKLSDTDQRIIKERKLETFEDVISLLLQKVEKKSLIRISELLNNSLKP